MLAVAWQRSAGWYETDYVWHRPIELSREFDGRLRYQIDELTETCGAFLYWSHCNNIQYGVERIVECGFTQKYNIYKLDSDSYHRIIISISVTRKQWYVLNEIDDEVTIRVYYKLCRKL